MTTHSQTALAFCREVLGWADPAQLNPSSFYDAGRDMIDGPLFHPSDLNDVMAAVRGWLGTRAKLNLSIQGEDCVVLIRGTTDGLFAATTRRDLCEALMAACLEASRSMKAP